MTTYPLLNPNETLLIGGKFLFGGSVIADDVSKRIEFLILNSLIQQATDESGWIVLYLDPQDSRYWELSYSTDGEQGGGSPILQCISDAEAKLKFLNRNE